MRIIAFWEKHYYVLYAFANVLFKVSFESPHLPSLLSPLYFQDIFLIRKNYIWQDKWRKLEFRRRIDYSGAVLRHRADDSPIVCLPASSSNLHITLTLIETAPKWQRPSDVTPTSTIKHICVWTNRYYPQTWYKSQNLYRKITYSLCISNFAYWPQTFYLRK